MSNPPRRGKTIPPPGSKNWPRPEKYQPRALDFLNPTDSNWNGDYNMPQGEREHQKKPLNGGIRCLRRQRFNHTLKEGTPWEKNHFPRRGTDPFHPGWKEHGTICSDATGKLTGGPEKEHRTAWAEGVIAQASRTQYSSKDLRPSSCGKRLKKREAIGGKNTELFSAE